MFHRDGPEAVGKILLQLKFFLLQTQMNAMKPIPAKANPVKTFLEVTGVPVAKVTKRRIEKQDVKVKVRRSKV